MMDVVMEDAFEDYSEGFSDDSSDDSSEELSENSSRYSYADSQEDSDEGSYEDTTNDDDNYDESDDEENDQEEVSFPKFRRLPPEVRLMVWKASVPRRALSLVGNGDEEVLPLPAPSIASVCHESRTVFHELFKQPYLGLGWFRPNIDTFIWEDQQGDDFKYSWASHLSKVPNLTSLTFSDLTPFDWVENMYADDWNPVEAYKLWGYSKRGAPIGLELIFNLVIHNKLPLRTLNFFNHQSARLDSIMLDPRTFTPAIAQLFNFDAVLTIDHTNATTVQRAAAVLSTGARADTAPCVRALTHMYRALDAAQREAHWNALRFDCKLVWLWEVYLAEAVRGLPKEAPRVVGWDYAKNELRMNWDEDDPVVRACLDRMPEIKFVYVLTADD